MVKEDAKGRNKGCGSEVIAVVEMMSAYKVEGEKAMGGKKEEKKDNH